MFEKEAEKYYYKNVFAETDPTSETELKEKFLQTFEDSAEFGYNKGYNKAKEEMQAQIEKMIFEFTSIDRVSDFVKPLIVEGKYEISIRTFFKEYPVSYSIDYFEVIVKEIK